VPDLEDVYSSEEEQSALAAALFPRYERMLVVVHQMVQSAFPELSPDDFRLDDAATLRLLTVAAEHVTMIDETTRKALQEVLQEGQRRGYSDTQIADGVPSEGYGGVEGLYLNTWKGRPELIARTELSTAQVAASLDRYEATGLVSKVELVEHTDTDDECARRNGTVVPITSRPGLLHPQCRVAVVPVVDEVA
jgi:flagellar biosynthesis/type III secretory pathway protein FliH